MPGDEQDVQPDENVKTQADENVKTQAATAIAKLKEIIAELETEEGLARLSSGDLKFEIKPGTGVMWYTAYGTT